MKSANLFPKVFGITALATFGFLCLTSYAGKQALAADPELLNRLQSKYNVRISGFSVTPSRDVTKDRWNFSAPVQMLKVNTISAEMRVMPADGNELIIEAEGRLPADAQAGDRLLKIKMEDSEITVSEEKDIADLSLIIKVPKDTAKLVLGTISGSVMAKNISAKEFKFKSISGDLNAENVFFDSIDGGTISGDVELSNLVTAPARIKFESVSGDIDLKLPKEQKSKFSLTTVSGEIKNSLPSVEGTEVKIKTTSGDIEIE